MKNNKTPNFLWYSLSLNGLNAFTPEGVKESKIIWLHNPRNIENTSNVKLIFKGGMNPVLTATTKMAIATKNIGESLLLRKSNANAIININRIIRFLELLKSRLQEDKPIAKKRKSARKTVITNAPKIEWVNPLWLETRKMLPSKMITRPK